jgi:uncharacterized protein
MCGVPFDTFRSKLLAWADKYFPKNDPAHDPLHQKRMVGLVEHMVRKEGGDPYISLAIAVLHDVPLMLSAYLNGKSKTMYELAQEAAYLLEKIDPVCFRRDTAFVKLVARGIAAQFESPANILRVAQPVSIEALHVHAAEDMEGMGAIGWARAFTMGGIGRRRFYSIEYPDIFCRVRQPQKDFSTIDFLLYRARKISARMECYTPTAQALLAERISFLTRCITDFEKHIDLGDSHRRFLEQLPLKERQLRAKFLELVDTYYAGKDPAHDPLHVRRVIANMEKIWLKEGRPEQAPLEALWIAGFAHDLVQYDKHSPKGAKAALHSARRALNFLSRDIRSLNYVIPIESVHLGLKAAAVHSWSHGNSKDISLVAQILQDADRWDNVGAMGLARTFTMGPILRNKRPLHATEDPFCESRDPNGKVATLDMILTRLKQVPARLNTAYVRDVIQYGAAFLDEYLVQFRRELTDAGQIHQPVAKTREVDRASLVASKEKECKPRTSVPGLQHSRRTRNI